MPGVSFEMSSEVGRERHVLIPWARLTDATPTKGDPAQITGLVPGLQETGVVMNPGSAADPYAVLNVADGRMERQNVRNVLTYTAGPVAEATFGPINIGDPVFYDAEQDTLNGVKLSTSPLQSDGTTANAQYGIVIMQQEEDAADFPKGTALAGSTNLCAVLCTH